MVQIWVDCSDRVDLYRTVSAEIHSGANKMQLVFPRSPTAFCGEYTQAHQLSEAFCGEYTQAHQFSEAFCGEYTQAHQLSEAFCGDYTQAHQLSEAFCGEYTQVLMRCIQYFLEDHLRFVVNTLWCRWLRSHFLRLLSAFCKYANQHITTILCRLAARLSCPETAGVSQDNRGQPGQQ